MRKIYLALALLATIGCSQEPASSSAEEPYLGAKTNLPGGASMAFIVIVDGAANHFSTKERALSFASAALDETPTVTIRVVVYAE